MNKKYVLLALAVLVLAGVGVGWYAYEQYRDNQMVVAVMMERIDNSELGLSFVYPSGEEAFSLVESPTTATSGLLKAYVLMPTTEYFEFQATGTVPRETPPAISILVFEDTTATSSATSTEALSRRTRLENWAVENTALTSFDLALNAPLEVDVDGVDALQYRADGLYQQDIYLALYRGRIFMFATQFNAETDSTYTAFQDLIKTVTFE